MRKNDKIMGTDQKKNILYAVLLVFLTSFILLQLFSDNLAEIQRTNNLYETIQKLPQKGIVKPSYSYSYVNLQPNGDSYNINFQSSPLYSKIDDLITSPNDGDYIRGGPESSAELEIGTSSLGTHQSVSSIQIYLRGRNGGTEIQDIVVNVNWRIGSGSYNTAKIIEFTQTDFEWQSSSQWTGLSLDLTSLNALRIQITPSGAILDQYVDISVMYVRIQIKTNETPVISIISPIMNENLVGDNYLIQWSSSDPENNPLSYDLYYKIGVGGSWQTITLDLESTSSYLWDLTDFTTRQINVYLMINVSDPYTTNSDINGPFLIHNQLPTVILFSPNGDEVLENTQLIEWSYNDLDGDSGNFSLYYQLDGGEWILITDNITGVSEYLWNLNGFTQRESQVMLLIEAEDGYGGFANDTSNGEFRIFVNHDPTVALLSPNGGEILETTQLIEWSFDDLDGDNGNFSLYYQLDAGEWILIIDNVTGVPEYLWNLNGFTQRESQVMLLIEAEDGYGGFANDTSNGEFRIFVNHDPTVALLSPNGGEILETTQLIEWSYSDPDGDNGNFSLYYRIGEEEWILITDNITGVSEYLWNLNGFTQRESQVMLLIEVEDGYGGFANKTSDNPFQVFLNHLPTISLLSPNGGEILEDIQLIEWTYNDIDGDNGNFSLYYRINEGEWMFIVDNLIGVSEYLWNFSTFTQRESLVTLLIEVNDGYAGFANDTCNNTFQIFLNHAPLVVLLSPNGGEILEVIQLIEWSYNDFDGDIGNFSLYYRIDEGEWSLIIENLTGVSEYLWNLSVFTNRESSVILFIEVEDTYRETANDTSDGTFQIFLNHVPSVILHKPQESDFDKKSILIHWNYTDADGDIVFFNLYYRVDNHTWISIVLGLENVDRYLWNIEIVSIDLSKMEMLIEAYDEYGGSSSYLDENFAKSINISKNNNWIFFVIGLGAVAAIGAPYIIIRYYKKSMNQKKEQQTPPMDISYHASQSKILIEGDVLIKKGENDDTPTSILTLLADQRNETENRTDGDYQAFKVFGAFKISSLSVDFYEKLNKLEWNENDKAEFVNEMLSLEPEEREALLDEMLRKSGVF